MRFYEVCSPGAYEDSAHGDVSHYFGTLVEAMKDARDCANSGHDAEVFRIEVPTDRKNLINLLNREGWCGERILLRQFTRKERAA